MIMSPLPMWKELLRIKKETSPYWENIIKTKRSGLSIRLIIEEYKKSSNKDEIYIWIPGFFCGETEKDFDISYVKIIHYPLTDSLDPDWEKIKLKFSESQIDVFLFVHYFGVYHDANQAKLFCVQKRALLIEDGAHCLYPYCKIGQAGDFTLFSCHKLLPIPDGAIIMVNPKARDEIQMIYKKIEEYIKDQKKGRFNIGWRVKKAIQKIIRLNKPYQYELKEHYYEGNNRYKDAEDICISNYSEKVVATYGYEDLKKISHIRRENTDIISQIVLDLDNEIINLIPNDCVCPYFAVFSIKNCKNKELLINRIQQIGLPVMHWPDLPISIRNDVWLETERQRAYNIILIPVHQDIKPSEIAACAPFNVEIGKAHKNFSIIRTYEKDKERWEKIYCKIDNSNITQHWTYGDIKERAEKWGVERFIIQKEGKDIGILQILSKKIAGKKIVYRINKGPIFLTPENSIENELEVMEQVWQSLSHPCILLYVPYSFMSAVNYIKTIKYGWKNWDIYGFPSGTVNLTLKEEEIRKSLDSKWRNQLKSAENRGYEIRTDNLKFDDMLQLYMEEQKQKGFRGVSRELLTFMNVHEDKPLRFFYIENGTGQLLAFDIFYRHGKVATYYIGWNSEEGRKQYLNNLLLYSAAILLKEEGIESLDLGGIEYIHTESIARFKDGMNPYHFRQMGEFVRIG